ncbi:hypothetical protein M011DRAFT_477429 [Sporormia fimetaria CBS 119925]|uniref:F-box domain-containing protein n=1 Tax=Sporormia fimetaria CBS 119925 TaxID=1340428 RepID=A0A6A6VA05_9PLEO|nr:hypothetical protein M011DRAFT_477429 [Sporormia fimetaria CBS 119925]
MTTTIASLPDELWLMVLPESGNAAFLWSVVRNVCKRLRACVDAYFSYEVMQNTFVNLLYSNINSCHGSPPFNRPIFIPMVPCGYSRDMQRVIFQQRAYKEWGPFINRLKPVRTKVPIDHAVAGTVNGWVPFAERYYRETKQIPPRFLNRSAPCRGVPVWKKELAQVRNKHPRQTTLMGQLRITAGYEYENLARLLAAVTIGQGDRPPFLLKVLGDVNDTELVDLVVDCERGLISFDWKKTFSLFFRERRFTPRASSKDLTPEFSRKMDRETAIRVMARRKRMRPWLESHKTSHHPELLYLCECHFRNLQLCLKKHLHHGNLRTLANNEYCNPDEIIGAVHSVDEDELEWWGRGFCAHQCIIFPAFDLLTL